VLGAATVLAIGAGIAQAAGPEAGTARFVKAAGSDFDRYTQNPSTPQRGWMNAKYWRMRAYAPYFDSRLSWFSDAWAYHDLYAIYVGQDLAREHPEWILKDSQGRRLYIPWGCSGGSCPQYAGDVGNPEFRAYWIAEAVATMAKGYRGLFVDDVNMEFRVGNGQGDEVAPRDPRTGRTMTESDWRRYVAEFTEQIRAALPGKEIVHNAIWFSGHQDPYVRRELDAADYIELERGVNDGGIRGGVGRFGFETFMARVDYLHSRGKGVIFDSYVEGDAEREYGLASYFLVSSGRDGIGNDPGGTPGDWWRGYDVSLGAPRGPRYRWNGVFRRDFERGFALVNQPDEPTRRLDLGGRKSGPLGQARESVTLGPAEGAVLLGSPAAAAAAKARTATVVTPLPNPGPSLGRKSRLRRAALVRGRVRGGSGGRVHVRIKRKVGGRWRTSRLRGVPVDSGGRFATVFRRLKRGRYRVRARYLGSSRAAVSRSGRRHFRLSR
jgi:Hypothetical glycosyl hydrolase family 15